MFAITSSADMSPEEVGREVGADVGPLRVQVADDVLVDDGVVGAEVLDRLVHRVGYVVFSPVNDSALKLGSLSIMYCRFSGWARKSRYFSAASIFLLLAKTNLLGPAGALAMIWLSR